MQARLPILLLLMLGMCCPFAGCSTARPAGDSQVAALGPEESLAEEGGNRSVRRAAADVAESAVKQVVFDDQGGVSGLLPVANGEEDLQDAGDIASDAAPGATEASLSDLEHDALLPPPAISTELNQLLNTAVDRNPKLVRLYGEYQAATARSQYADKLPDPKIGANVFGNPIETASGSQRANMTVSQSIPWLGRLDAQQQQACFEAFAIRSEYAAERLRVIAGVRVGWYRLYVVDRQIETALANQKLLESLIDVANARISTGSVSQGDVLLGTVELSKLEERLLMYRKQQRGIQAEINRLVGRAGDTPIASPSEIVHDRIRLNAAEILQTALDSQPEIDAARLRTQATRWGIEVARLSRRPEFMLSASYFITDNNRPPTSVVNVGQDPWALGVQVSVPLWKEKYDAMENEAAWKHQAAQASVDDLADRYDAMIVDLMAEAQRAAETAELYSSTILPQARQTLSSDQDSYSNGNVEFDRVVRDYRNLLTLELGFHEAVGELAIANARLQQAAGVDLPTVDVESRIEGGAFPGM